MKINYFEINKKKWNEFYSTTKDHYEEIAEGLIEGE